MKKFILSAAFICTTQTFWSQNQQFTTTGGNNFVPHTSVIELTFEAIGGGGGGGRVTNASVFDHKVGGGGGGGAYVKSFPQVIGGNTYVVTVGTAGYNNSNGAEAHGGDSFFGTGTEGRAKGGFTKTGNGANNSPGAIGGQATSSVIRHKTGTTNTALAFNGGTGGTGDDGPVDGGGGGGAAGSTGAGGNGSMPGAGARNSGPFLNTTIYGGNGGAGGGGGATGAAGAAYGGGGGGSSAQSGASRSGGSGASGFVLITWSQINSLSAASGCPGDIITINGSNFVNVSNVTFNGVAATVNSYTATSINVTVPTASSGDIIITTEYGRAKAAFTFSSTVSAPSAISGTATICAAGSQTYSVVNDPSATSYTWSLPSGWSGTSTTNTITTTTNGQGGIISVIANGICGNSPATSLTINAGTTPSQPSSITGNTSICFGANDNYSVLADPSATSYTWTLPTGWSGTSTSNTINVTPDNTSGTISVIASNACGNSTAATLAITIAGAVPTQPLLTQGNVNLCANTSDNFDVNLDPLSSYTWSLTGDLTGSSTSNSISITSGPNGGIATVTATNVCGSSLPENITIVPDNTPDITNAVIAGSISICANSNQTYTLNNALNASSYSWNVPTGWSGTSNTNSIQIVSGTSNGTISVSATNSCGTSAAITLPITIQTQPAQPSVITGNTLVCSAGSQTYSVINDTTVSSYTWTLPSGWSGTSNTNSISVNPGSSGVISVIANGNCGGSTPSQLQVNFPGIASTIIYPVTCRSFVLNGQTYSQTGVYQQTLTTLSGCDSSVTIHLTMTPFVNSAVTTTGGAMIATETNAYYQWINCSTNATILFATERDFYPSTNGQYAVIVTKDGCTDTSQCVAMNKVSTEDFSTIESSIFPNPTSNATTLSINNTQGLEDIILSMFDVTGKIVKNERFTLEQGLNNILISTEDIAGGIYFIRVTSKTNLIFNQKLILNK